MFDDNVTAKILFAFVAAVATALRIVLADRRMRRLQPGFSLAADTWSTEKFGIWWAGRGVMVLAILVAGICFAFLGRGSSAGSLFSRVFQLWEPPWNLFVVRCSCKRSRRSQVRFGSQAALRSRERLLSVEPQQPTSAGADRKVRDGPEPEVNATNGLTRTAICRHQYDEQCRDAFHIRCRGCLLRRRLLLQFRRASLHASLPRVTERPTAC